MTGDQRPAPSTEWGAADRRADLPPLLCEVATAAALLESPDGDELVLAQQRLTRVEASLTDLVAHLGLSSAAAPALLAIRDELSVHLLASTMLGPLDLHDQAVGVLRRAVASLHAGLEALLDVCVATAFAG